MTKYTFARVWNAQSFPTEKSYTLRNELSGTHDCFIAFALNQADQGSQL